MSLSAQAVTPARQLTPVENYAAQVIGGDERESELWSALPAHIRPDRFKRNLVNLLMQKPDMLKYDPRFVYREVSKAAALGLLLDPQLGEAYIVPVWNAAKGGAPGREEPQLRVGYRGLIKLARQSGEIKRIYAHEVCQFDEIDCELGVEKSLRHKPNLFADRGVIIGYYAVVHYADGETDFEPMTVGQIHAIRDKSEAWKAFQAGRIKATPWATDESEMAKKTVIRRLLKRVPQSPELSDAVAIENAADGIDPRTVATHAHVSQLQPPRTVRATLDIFASRSESSSADDTPPVADEAPVPAAAAAQSDSNAGAPASSEPEVAPAPGASGDGDAGPPDPLAQFRRLGRTVCEAGGAREIPRALAYKSKQTEASAWLEGWDDAHVEKNGVVY